jgi:hypothetical protein
VHPTDFNTPTSDGKTQLIVLKAALPYESYAVAALINLTDTAAERRISLAANLRLDDGKYLIHDYFDDELLGVCEGDIILGVKPYDTRLIIVRPLLSRPQLLSSSRHIMGGAHEIENVTWCEDSSTLVVTANLVGNEKYTMTLHVPGGYEAVNSTVGYLSTSGNVARINCEIPSTGQYDFVIKFTKTTKR